MKKHSSQALIGTLALILGCVIFLTALIGLDHRQLPRRRHRRRPPAQGGKLRAHAGKPAQAGCSPN